MEMLDLTSKHRTKPGYEMQVHARRDESTEAVRCKRGDLRSALDAKHRAVCMHRTSQGPTRVKSAMLSMFDLKKLDDMLPSSQHYVSTVWH